MFDPNAGAAAGGSGLTVGTGQYTTAKTYQTGSGVYESQIPRFDPVESIADLPDRLYADPSRIGEYQSLMELVKNAGFSSWGEAISAAALDPMKSERSWQDYLVARASDPNLQAFLAKTGRGSGGGVSNSRTVSTDESSRSEAGNILDQNFREQLGRTASKQEIIDFQEKLNEQQSRNPTVTQSRTVSGGRSSSTRSATSGGFDYTRFARQYAQSQPGFQDRYAAVTFMDILDSAISDPNAIDKLVAGS